VFSNNTSISLRHLRCQTRKEEEIRMIVSNIELYVILLKRDSLGTIIRLFPVIAWANRDDSLVAVIPTNVDEDDYKKAYPVDDPLVISEYGRDF